MAYVFPSPIHLQITSSTAFLVPVGAYRNKQSYDVQVYARTDPGGLNSFSERVPIHIDYEPAPSLTNVQAVAVPLGDDPWPTAIRVSWDATEIGILDGWQRYVIRRSASAGPDMAERIVAEITSPGDIAFLDPEVVSGVEYAYRVSQVQMIGLDEVESEPIEATAAVTLRGAVLHDTQDVDGLRLVLGSVQERVETWVTNQVELETWGGGPPYLLETGLDGVVVAVEARLYRRPGDGEDTVLDRLAAFRALRGTRADGSPVGVCYRDERGRRHYGRLREPEIADQRLMRGDVAFEVWETGQAEKETN